VTETGDNHPGLQILLDTNVCSETWSQRFIPVWNQRPLLFWDGLRDRLV